MKHLKLITITLLCIITFVILSIISSGCATTKDFSLKNEMNQAVKEGFGNQSTYLMK
jgi:hypothetical protein